MSSTIQAHARCPKLEISSTLIAALLFMPAAAAAQTSNKSRSLPSATTTQPPATATQTPTSIGKHGADNNPGKPVSGMSGGEEAGIIAGAATVAVGLALLIHHEQHKLPGSNDLLQNGPRIPQNVLMSHMTIDGLIGPAWPVAVDFALEGPGYVTLDITTADKTHIHQDITNNLNARGIAVMHPTGLPDTVQSAVFDIEAVAPAGSNLPPPNVRLYGVAVGPRVVGSIAIDEMTFGPSAVKMKQPVAYGFHSHSDFSNVRADFMFTGLKDNHIVMKQDNETTLSPVSPDEHAQGSLQTSGTAGQHLLQIRAWRGNSGDWVAAWSPDIVTLSK